MSKTDFIRVAQRECCYWYDDGRYCPACEFLPKHGCKLLDDIPCGHFEGSVLPLTHLPIHSQNKSYDGGMLAVEYRRWKHAQEALATVDILPIESTAMPLNAPRLNDSTCHRGASHSISNKTAHKSRAILKNVEMPLKRTKRHRSGTNVKSDRGIVKQVK